jgi:hypothetical protein
MHLISPQKVILEVRGMKFRNNPQSTACEIASLLKITLKNWPGVARNQKHAAIISGCNNLAR